MRILHKIVLVLLPFLFALSCDTGKDEYADGKICRCLLFPTSALDYTYQFEIDTNRVIRTTLGWQIHNLMSYVHEDKKITSQDMDFYEKISRQKEGKLSQADYDTIRHKCSELKRTKCENEFIVGGFNDAWGVILFIGKERFIFLEDSHLPENKKYEELLKELIRVSPIRVHWDRWPPLERILPLKRQSD